jgi:hypothetical protein
MSRIKLTPVQAKTHIIQYFQNCEKQIANGDRPTSLCIEGKAGIAKTSLIKQLAKEAGYRVHQINAAMIDDLGHLVGFPEKEFEIQYFTKDGDVVTSESKWVPAEFSQDAIQDGGKYTGGSRMAYAIPHWLKEIADDEKFILLLDDFTRGLPMVMQACMTLVEEYRYGSWELPKNSIIMLTTNPDNGEYSVASLDTAQKTRMRYVEMIFDTEAWARWAESVGMDGRCINFVLNNPELFHDKHDGIGGGKDYNARIMTKFFNDIGCLPDFKSSLEYVKICGDGSVGEQFTNTFITFIHNRLDQLPSPQQLLEASMESAIKMLGQVCGNYKTRDGYQPATASIMASRIANYAIYGQHERWGKAENDKVIALMLSDCFADDLKLFMTQKFMSEDAKKQSHKLSTISLHPEIVKMAFRS